MSRESDAARQRAASSRSEVNGCSKSPRHSQEEAHTAQAKEGLKKLQNSHKKTVITD